MQLLRVLTSLCFLASIVLNCKSPASSFKVKKVSFEDETRYCVCRQCSKSYSPRASLFIQSLPTEFSSPISKPNSKNAESFIQESLEIFLRLVFKNCLTSIALFTFQQFQSSQPMSGWLKELITITIKVLAGVMALGFSNTFFAIVSASYQHKLSILFSRVCIQRSMRLLTGQSFKSTVTVLSTEINRVFIAKPLDKLMKGLLIMRQHIKDVSKKLISQTFLLALIVIKFKSKLSRRKYSGTSSLVQEPKLAGNRFGMSNHPTYFMRKLSKPSSNADDSHSSEHKSARHSESENCQQMKLQAVI